MVEALVGRLTKTLTSKALSGPDFSSPEPADLRFPLGVKFKWEVKE